jgi:FtsH-binding integral membrane protein
MDLLFNQLLGKDQLIDRAKEILYSAGIPYSMELAILFEKDILGFIIMALCLVLILICLFTMFINFGALKKLVLIASLVIFSGFFIHGMSIVQEYKFLYEEDRIIAQKYIEQAKVGETFNIDSVVLRSNFNDWKKQGYVEDSFIKAEKYGLGVNAKRTKLLITYEYEGKEITTSIPSREIDRVVNSYVQEVSNDVQIKKGNLYTINKFAVFNLGLTVLLIVLVVFIILLAFTKNCILKKALIFIFCFAFLWVFVDVGILSTQKDYKDQIIRSIVNETISRLHNHETYEISSAVILENYDEWMKKGYLEEVDVSKITHHHIDFDNNNLYYWYQLEGYGGERFLTKLGNEQIIMFVRFIRPFPINLENIT